MINFGPDTFNIRFDAFNQMTNELMSNKTNYFTVFAMQGTILQSDPTGEYKLEPLELGKCDDSNFGPYTDPNELKCINAK